MVLSRGAVPSLTIPSPMMTAAGGLPVSSMSPLSAAFNGNATAGYLTYQHADPTAPFSHRQPPRALDAAFSNAPLSVVRFSPLLPDVAGKRTAQADSESLLAALKGNPFFSIHLKQHDELGELYAELHHDVTLPSDPSSREAFLKEVPRLSIRVFQDVVRRHGIVGSYLLEKGGEDDGSTIPEQLIETLFALRPLIDHCMMAHDPAAYASFVTQKVKTPLLFMELGPLFAFGNLESIRLMPVGKERLLARMALKNIGGLPGFDQRFNVIIALAEAIGLDSNLPSVRDGIILMLAHLTREGDTIDPELLELMTLGIEAQTISDDIREAAQSDVMNVAQFHFLQFCQAFGFVLSLHDGNKLLIPFKASASLGEEPFGIQVYQVMPNGMPFPGLTLSENIGVGINQTITRALIRDAKIPVFNHEMWHAMEHAFYRLDLEHAAELTPAEQAEAAAALEFRALMGAWALYDADDSLLQKLQGLKSNAIESDLAWQGAQKDVIRLFAGIDDRDPSAIRAKAHEQINRAYQDFFGLTLDEVFQPFRR